MNNQKKYLSGLLSVALVVTAMAPAICARAAESVRNGEGISVRVDTGKKNSKKYSGERINLHFKGAALKAVLESFSHFAGIPVKVEEELPEQVSLKMDQVPWDEALDIILKGFNLEMKKDASAIRIRRKKNTGKNASIPDVLPVTGYFTSGYGFRNHPITKKRVFHAGLDIAAMKGTAVRAAADGVVKKTFKDKYSGFTMVIDHENGYVTKYCQLDSFKVKKGQRVKKGECIAAVGNSGRSTGPHLHWEILHNGKNVDPMTVTGL